MVFTKDKARLAFCLEKGRVNSLVIDGKELISEEAPIFKISLRDKDGHQIIVDSDMAQRTEPFENGAGYLYLPGGVSVKLTVGGEGLASWGIEVENHGENLIEWVEYPCINVRPLKKNGGGGEILFPYNEGALVDDIDIRESEFRHFEAAYPSLGAYAVFPNMLCSQFMCYMSGGCGLYIGCHDEKRGVKQIDFYKTENGIALQTKIFCGCERGADYVQSFPIVWDVFEGEWQDGAEIYRRWFDAHLFEGMKKVRENPALPEWYKDCPLIVTYPVRGVHDMDNMTPNELYPYTNALPMIEDISERTGWRVMAVLMHWEGTAPWSPPYVWPPYGGEDNFNEFAERLHEKGNLLGVYCSGFGYTIQSNLISGYNMQSEYDEKRYVEAMCVSPEGKVELSRICRAQRSGYDLCVKSEKAREILDRAYRPLFESNIDYAQILDQNHGGGQYFCYSENHGHPPAPGEWMTSSMRELLSDWNKKAGKKLLGCESAASEAFIQNLLFSDNRYELNWHLGRPVPLYAYLYHEYLHNFMGNQVSSGLSHLEDTMCYRMAYSFINGDSMALIMQPCGKLMSAWGCRDFEHIPKLEKSIEFAANMRKLYETDAGKYLYCGRMIKPEGYNCQKRMFTREKGTTLYDDEVISSAWELDGERAQIFINYGEKPVKIVFRGEGIEIAPLNGVCVKI